MGSVKKVTNSIKKTISDPARLVGTYAGYAMGGGLPGMAAGNAAGKYISTDIPKPDLSTLEGQQQLQAQLVGNQLQAAEDFNKNLPAYIEQEYASRAAPVEDQFKSGRTNLMASLSGRGMLSSGNAIKQRANLEANKAQTLGGLRAETIQDATQRAQAYRIDPLSSLANANEQKTNFAGNLDALKRQSDQNRQALIGQGLGMIGSGVGQGIANRTNGRLFSGGYKNV